MMSERIAPAMTTCSSRSRRAPDRAAGPDPSAVLITSVDISYPAGGSRGASLDHKPVGYQTVRSRRRNGAFVSRSHGCRYGKLGSDHDWQNEVNPNVVLH